jgi:peptidoglycan-associated lipoprotein
MNMKLTKLASLMACALVIGLAATGCKKKPDYLTGIPPGRTPKVATQDLTQTAARRDTPPAIPFNPQPPVTQVPITPQNPQVPQITDKPIGEVPQPNPTNFDNYIQNDKIFEAYTVHFAFDSSAVQKHEQHKVAAVADYLKSHKSEAVRVAGHCDERGTAEYNRALGERRALALREELMRLSVEPSRVDTVSFGFDQPVDTAHNEAAWAKNRRGAFILLTPPGK